ncbi:SigE family RNA polymerase sigma factor [Salinispora sp. H7-4]|uniref:SigE family RNA polymerase sigma factor n=1 Tax=Salinispora sp. H7-4 TaxID=2748321 RepID=UPI0015D46747|nr:SigE family RNA polymerase sigma factor [Salinispora sp. H7-4]NYT96235.1 SigE family RNA polymerase sigma factor [Salinispora sp. H7-4]
MSGQDQYAGFREFVLSRGQALSRAAYLLTGDHQAAEDLLQEALTRTVRHWRRIERDGRPEAYVRTVMVNQLRSWYRRRRPIELSSASVPDRSGEPDVADHVTQQAALARLLALLPPRQRAVLYLRYYEDLSEVDTARLLRCSVGTVKRHAHDALVRLRKQPAHLLDSHPSSEARR